MPSCLRDMAGVTMRKMTWEVLISSQISRKYFLSFLNSSRSIKGDIKLDGSGLPLAEFRSS